MRYAILGDIHGNIQALEAVLDRIAALSIDEVLCTGDIVGLSMDGVLNDPKACLDRIRKACTSGRVVAGNHDFAACGKLDIAWFNRGARESVHWTRNQLSETDLAYLRSLELVQRIDGVLTLVHATLHLPELFDYVTTSYDAQLCLERLDTPVCFIGHSHVPVTFLDGPTVTFTMEPEIVLDPLRKTLVNVGSVGQPRDGDARAAFAIYDTSRHVVRIERVEHGGRGDPDGRRGDGPDPGLDPARLGPRSPVGSLAARKTPPAD